MLIICIFANLKRDQRTRSRSAVSETAYDLKFGQQISASVISETLSLKEFFSKAIMICPQNQLASLYFISSQVRATSLILSSTQPKSVLEFGQQD